MACLKKSIIIIIIKNSHPLKQNNTHMQLISLPLLLTLSSPLILLFSIFLHLLFYSRRNVPIYRILILFLLHSLLQDIGQILQLVGPCKIGIVITNSCSLMTGLWTCLLTYLVLKELGNPEQKVDLQRLIRWSMAGILAAGAGMAALLSWLVRLRTNDSKCWLRPQTSPLSIYLLIFYFPYTIPLAINLLLFIHFIVKRIMRGILHGKGHRLMYITLVQMISATSIILARTIILEQGDSSLQEVCECLALFQHWGYSIVLQTDPKMQQMIREEINNNPNRHSISSEGSMLGE